MPTSTLHPSRPTPLSTSSARNTRLTVSIIAGLCVLLSLGGLGAASVASAFDRADYGEIPLHQSLGTPEKLEVSTDVGLIRVQVSDAVDQVELGLVEPGSTTLPAAGTDNVLGEWEISEQDDATTVNLSRPGFQGNIGWATRESLDLLVFIPTELSEDLDLSVQAHVGNIEATGSFEQLHTRTRIGDINLPNVATTGDLVAHADVGQIRLGLADEHQGEVNARLDVGSVTVTVPCCEAWDVRATNDVGDISVDSALDQRTGTSIVVRSNVGDVTVEQR
ncbi:MAG: hypothetical protein ACTHZ5_09945 [Micrococcaceae bacterium]